MAALGYRLYLDPAVQSPIIATFRLREDGPDFTTLYHALVARNLIIYPGKLIDVPSFRIGCIGPAI